MIRHRITGSKKAMNIPSFLSVAPFLGVIVAPLAHYKIFYVSVGRTYIRVNTTNTE